MMTECPGSRCASRWRSGSKRDEVTVDFTGSDPQAAGPVNANLAIVIAATGYVFRCLLREQVPFTAGSAASDSRHRAAGTRRLG